MTRESTPDLLVLHAVRLVGFGDDDVIARRARMSRSDVLRMLGDAEDAGWVRRVGFADLDGWALTDAGTKEDERRLAEERATADPDGVIASVHREFLPLNARLLAAITDWQIAPTDTDRFAPNTHTDVALDSRVLDELDALSSELAALNERLSGVLRRFDGYATRYADALRRGVDGELEWIDRTDVDSCHRVWFQLHEDLVATLGIDRRDYV